MLLGGSMFQSPGHFSLGCALVAARERGERECNEDALPPHPPQLSPPILSPPSPVPGPGALGQGPGPEAAWGRGEWVFSVNYDI